MAAAPVARPLAGWGLPPGVLGKAALVAVLALAPVLVALVVIGPVAAASAGLGVSVGLAAATALPVAGAAAVVGLHTLVALVGSLVALAPGGAALLVGASGFACAPANRLGFGRAMVLLPVMAALASAGIYGSDPLAGVLGIAIGAAWTILLVRLVASRAGLRQQRQPVPPAAAWAHAITLGLSAAVATYVALAVPLPHAYWIVVTLSAVLVPVTAETVNATRDRVLGTLAGGLLAVTLGALLPTPLLVAAMLGALWLLVGYAVVGDGARKVAMLTVLLVLVLSITGGTSAVGIALERLAWTILAAAMIAVAGFAIARLGGAATAAADDASPTAPIRPGASA